MNAALLLIALCGQLIPNADKPALGLPYNDAVYMLGDFLFNLDACSENGEVSCATCHIPRFGYAQPTAVSIGISGKAGVMNAPTLIGAMFSPFQFHNGRASGDLAYLVRGTAVRSVSDSAIAQARGPLTNPSEMGRQTMDQVVNRLASRVDCQVMFRAAYAQPDSPPDQNFVTEFNLLHALVAKQSNIVTFDTPLHRYVRGDDDALTPAARRGLTYVKELRCFNCHSDYWKLTDHSFHNNGMAAFFNGGPSDQSRFEILTAQQNADVDRVRGRRDSMRRAYKTPTWFGIAGGTGMESTAPFGHTGAFKDLRQVVAFYLAGGAIGGRRDPNIDPLIPRMATLKLGRQAQEDIVAFLEEGPFVFDLIPTKLDRVSP